MLRKNSQAIDFDSSLCPPPHHRKSTHLSQTAGGRRPHHSEVRRLAWRGRFDGNHQSGNMKRCLGGGGGGGS